MVSERPRIYIVDDDAVVRHSLKAFLDSVDQFECRIFAGGREFLDDIDTLAPGCILLDLRMPDIDGLSVLEKLGDRRELFRTVIMTGHGDVSSAVRAMKLGASDFIEKPFAEDFLLSILNRVIAEMSAREQTEHSRMDAEVRVQKLSARERDVLIGLMTGRSNKVLAHELGLSVRTVEMHRAHMMSRLGVTSLPDALRIAFEAGLFPSTKTWPTS